MLLYIGRTALLHTRSKKKKKKKKTNNDRNRWPWSQSTRHHVPLNSTSMHDDNPKLWSPFLQLIPSLRPRISTCVHTYLSLTSPSHTAAKPAQQTSPSPPPLACAPVCCSPCFLPAQLVLNSAAALATLVSSPIIFIPVHPYSHPARTGNVDRSLALPPCR